jgi:hypothetical protein
MDILRLGLDISTTGIPKTKADVSRLLAEIERQTNAVVNSGNRGIGSPATAVRQSRNPSSVPRISTDQSLEAFLKRQTGSGGLLQKFAGTNNLQKIIADVNAGAAAVYTAQGRPLDDLIRIYTRISKKKDTSESEVKQLEKEILEAQKLSDEVKASLVPTKVLQANRKAVAAQTKIQDLATNLMSRGFPQTGSYLETVTQFVRGVGMTNKTIGENLNILESQLVKEVITPQTFQTSLASLAKDANAVITSAQRNASSVFKESLKTTANNYAQAYQQTFASLLPGGLSSKSTIVDQAIAGTLRGELVTAAQKDAFSQLKVGRTEFSQAKLVAKDAKKPGFDMRTLIAELDKVDTSVQARIQSVTNQLTSLAAMAKSTKDTNLGLAVQALQTAVQKQIDELNAEVQRQRASIQEAATKAATSKSSVTKSPTASSDIAVKQFAAEARGFDATIGKLVDIAKGSPRGQSATVESFVQMANNVDTAIKDLIDVKFRGAIQALNRGLITTGSKAVVPETLFRDILDTRGFSTQTTNAGRVAALSGFTEADFMREVRARAPGLNNEQLRVVTDQLIAKTQDLIQSYRVLDEIVDNLNVQRAIEVRSAEEVAISERRYADSLDVRRNQPFVRGLVPQGGVPLTTGAVESPMSGMNRNQLLNMGFSAKAIQNFIEDERRANVKRGNALDGDENRQGPFSRLAAFAGRVSAIMGLLQATVGQVAFRIQDLVNRANELEKTASTIAAVSNNFEKFSEVLNVASKQQQRFGGSLNEQLSGFTSLVQITRRYNVDLEQLDNIARRLAIIDPLQGFSGASIALKEFFAGDITSLSRRFEIDRKTLNSVKNVANEADRLKALDDVLSKIGISNAVLEARAQSTAAQYDKLSGSIQNSFGVLGTALQEYFLGDVQVLNDALSGLSQELVNIQERRERVNEATRGISSLSEEFKSLKVEFNDSTPEDFFTGLTTSVNYTEEAIKRLRDETNKYIADLNANRNETGQALIPLFTPEDRDFLALFTQASSAGLNQSRILNARAEDPARNTGFLSNFSLSRGAAFAQYNETDLEMMRRVSGVYGQNMNQARGALPFSEELGGPLNVIGNLGATIRTLNGDIPLNQNMNALITSMNALTGGLVPALNLVSGFRNAFVDANDLSVLQLNEQRMNAIDPQRRELEAQLDLVSNRMLERQGQSFSGVALSDMDANQRAMASLYASRYGTMDTGLRSYLNKRSDVDQLRQIAGNNPAEQALALIQKERLDYLTQTDPLQKQAQFDEYLQILYDIIAAQVEVKATALEAFSPSLVNPYTKVAEDLGKIVKLSTDSSFGVERINSSVEFLNSQSKQYNDLLAEIVIKQYEELDAKDSLGKATVLQLANELGIVDATDESKFNAETQLEVISQATKQQRLQAFETEKSVSALQALNAEANSLNMTMMQLIELSKEFSSQLNDLTFGTLASSMSIQDQLNFTMDRLTSGTAANRVAGPQNQNDVFDLFKQGFGLIDQVVNEKSPANDMARDLKKLQEDYFDDTAKANKDYQKEMKQLAEDYYEDMKKLQEESEISKRGNKADFYESLFGMNLTEKQRADYIDQFKGYEAEAVKLRGEGNFTAAQAVLDTGTQNILNQAKYDEEVLDNKEKIKNSDEEIAELNKDMANAKEADDRAEIQRKIDKINQDKLEAENRIKQIEGLRVIRADADREEIEQARLKEEQITKDYKTEVDRRKTEHDEKLAEMEKAYNKSVQNRKEQDTEATKVSLANQQLLLEFATYSNNVMALAKLKAMGAPEEALREQRNLLSLGKDKLMGYASPEIRPLLNAFFSSMTTLKPSTAQTIDPVVANQLQLLTDNNTALINNTTALGNLVTTLGKTIVGNRLRVTFQP